MIFITIYLWLLGAVVMRCMAALFGYIECVDYNPRGVWIVSLCWPVAIPVALVVTMLRGDFRRI